MPSKSIMFAMSSKRPNHQICLLARVKINQIAIFAPPHAIIKNQKRRDKNTRVSKTRSKKRTRIVVFIIDHRPDLEASLPSSPPHADIGSDEKV